MKMHHRASKNVSPQIHWAQNRITIYLSAKYMPTMKPTISPMGIVKYVTNDHAGLLSNCAMIKGIRNPAKIPLIVEPTTIKKPVIG
jgi:hypothetical protein